MGGMLVLGLGYIVWGFIAPRFTAAKVTAAAQTGAAVIAIILLTLAAAAPASAGTLDRVKSTGHLRLGYRADARPLSYEDESGKPAGILRRPLRADRRGDEGRAGAARPAPSSGSR